MKKWMEKFREIKTAQWALLLIVLGLAVSFLFPAQEEKGGGDGAQSAGTELEIRLSRVLSEMEGAGRVEVVIRSEKAEKSSSGWLLQEESAEDGRPAGAVVVAEGAGNVSVRLRLSQAVETLLGLDAQSVEVFAMKREMEAEK